MVKLTEEMVIARSRISDLTAIKKLNCWYVNKSLKYLYQSFTYKFDFIFHQSNIFKKKKKNSSSSRDFKQKALLLISQVYKYFLSEFCNHRVQTVMPSLPEREFLFSSSFSRHLLTSSSSSFLLISLF